MAGYTTTTSKPVLDLLGGELHAGDWIAYGVGRGDLSYGLVLGFKEYEYTYSHYDAVTRTRTPMKGVRFKIQVKSPENDRPSLIESYRRHFIKIEKQPEGAEFEKPARRW